MKFLVFNSGDKIKPHLSLSPQVWSINPIMQTKATIMSKSPLLSLEWATKPDRLVKTTIRNACGIM